ncbi:histone-lysine N-methyltransferase eggless [Onthophagus taurus]|uniref:histone-lysine N-methyltransferase eggless n=1 Tax=Onthophagus taurus TaxID=166361 RepID=UPI0039BDA46B
MNENMEIDAPSDVGASANVEGTPTEDVIVLDDDEVCDLTTIKTANKCLNYACRSGENMIKPPSFCLSYYRVKTKLSKKQQICVECYNEAVQHYDTLAQAVFSGVAICSIETPYKNDVFEILDSDSDSGGEEVIDPKTMSFLEENFDETLNKVITTYNFNEQYEKCLKQLSKDCTRVQEKFNEVKNVYSEIRTDTDGMIFELSNLMRPDIHELSPIEINDDINDVLRNTELINQTNNTQTIISKLPNISPKPQNFVQKPLNKLPETTLSSVTSPNVASITQLTGEVVLIPSDLPPKGPIIKQTIKTGETYYTNRFEIIGTWVKGTLTGIFAPNKYEITIVSRQKTIKRMVTGKELAYSTPCNVQIGLGTRVIAVFRESTNMGEMKKNKKCSFYPGIIAEPLQLSNKYRYLIFFDDGYAQYVSHNHVHLIHEASSDVTEDINVNARAFVRKYLENYKNRALVKCLKDQTVRTEYNGRWRVATVLNVDCSLVQVYFDDINRIEWIYRGSTRFGPMFDLEQAAANRQHKHRFSRKPNATGPHVEFIREDGTICSSDNQSHHEQRSVARKSTAKSISSNSSSVVVPEQETPTTKIVYYTPRRQKPKTNTFIPHNCSPDCRTYMYCPLTRMKGYSPLAKPLLCGFYRLLYKVKHKLNFVIYRAPCGRTLRNIAEVHRYLQLTRSELTIDLFDFHIYVRCLAEFMVESKSIQNKDLSNGLEQCPITVCNYVDKSLLDFCNYTTKRQPMVGVDLNLDPNFLVCCDCTDDCLDRSKCACWQLTLQCLKYMEKGTDPKSVGYQYRRLLEPIFSGIYECNSRCHCRHTCLNRVVQNPMQHKLQVFKTDSRGWGIRSLSDIPEGSFVCIYAGSLLTEEMANLDGKSYGDEYLAELDFIETAERTKEDYEEDPYRDEIKKERVVEEPSDNEEVVDDFEEIVTNREDRDFVPSRTVPRRRHGFSIDDHETGIRSRLRKRNIEANLLQEKKAEKDVIKIGILDDDDTVMISDDEDYPPREPSSFNPMGEVDDKDSRKYKSVRELHGEEETVYIMDAKSTGNIGRFLNHSCAPNIFVQNVFVDTHDPRFPWVAFFTMGYVRAGQELTWNYNYDIGSVPGKVLYCFCGTSECKGRLL